MARTGRRPGNQDTREAILKHARDAFGEKGYEGASIRQIATSAGVDPALVHHYFGSKEQLFLAALQVPIDPGTLIPGIAAEGIDGFGERLVRTFLGVWDSPTGTAAAALIRSAVQHDWVARMLRDFLMQRILKRITTELKLEGPDVPLRVTLVGSQMMGLVFARYIFKVEPLASAPPETLVPWVGGTIQRYLTDPLP